MIDQSISQDIIVARKLRKRQALLGLDLVFWRHLGSQHVLTEY